MAVGYGLAGGYTPQIDPNSIDTTDPSFMTRLRGAGKSFLGNRDLALALLANSSGPTRQSFGSILGQSMMQADQMKQGREDDAFKRQYMQAQMQSMQAKPTGPSSVQEYQYARQNGYKGTYEDWTKLSGQTSRPSSVQEWEFYNALPQDQKQLYLEMKRNPNFKVAEIAGGQNVVQGTPGGGAKVTPLSTPQQEIDFVAQRKAAESQAGAIGTGAGGIIADIQKKGANAKTINSVLDLADPLIDASTGSMLGAGADKIAGAFGKSLSGAEASAQLQVLQAGLMLNQPRMEGPQSDADVLLYRQAAGQIGDPTVPRGIKKAALQTIRQLQQKYQDRAAQPFRLNPGGTPSEFDAETTSLLDKYAPRK
jgi:hypothetical protein